MRMRRKKHGPERLERCGFLWVKSPEDCFGKWKEEFKNDNPVHTEIGCGKGRFILETAKKNPMINFVAIERNIDVLVLAAEKGAEAGLKNVRYVLGDAETLEEIFASGECERIYLNFSDPWHKKRHEKRRLTHAKFLELYKIVLKKDGEIIFKTDNRPLFDYSLESFEQNGWKLYDVTFDLHAEDCTDNVETEYEQLFSSKGNPIHRLKARIKGM